MRARSLAQASPEGPLPMTATLCPLRLMSGAGILSAFSIFQSPTKRSSLPIATGSPLTPKTQEPSHWLSLRADAAADARQRAVLGDNGGSRSEITLHDLMDEIRNTDIHRTRRHAAGILAIQAAGRFERGFLDIITVAHLPQSWWPGLSDLVRARERAEFYLP